MSATVKIDLKNCIGEILSLSKPGKECDAALNNADALECLEAFVRLCDKEGEHTSKDMCVAAVALFEMQIKNNVPDEYVEASEVFAELVKQNKKLDVSERRDYVFFAYEAMRELEKLENSVAVEYEDVPEGVVSLASQDDDISAIVIVNNSDEDVMVNVEICGLPGRHTSIDYYRAMEYEPLSIVCNTDTKLEMTTVMIPLSPYSLHLFKIR